MELRLNILFISLLIGFAFPCSCLEPPLPEEAYEEADAVFSGQVTNIVVDESGYYHEVTFQIIDVWKGEDSEEITVLTETYSDACGYNFQINNEYLVYAYTYAGGNYTNICTRTNLLEYASEDLDYLNSLNSSQCQGDTNLDNNIDILDVITIVNHVLGNNLLDGEAFDNGDVDDNGELNVIDLVVIVESILNGDNECNDNFAPIDLSLEWEFQDDLSYFDSEELNNVISQMSVAQYLEGIIVVHDGEIVSESYYNGSSINQTFNIFSVTKSYTSTLIGQAIGQGYIDNQNITLNNLLPMSTQPYLAQISLHNLLSMSSGYADGFGYPYWVSATTTELEWMPYTFPGSFFYNNSACHLNSHVLYYATQMTPYEFASINLFPYLGIEDPQWLDGYLNINDGSASLELRLRDMIKLGQLYLQNGWSGDEQILSPEWIGQATSMQVGTNSPGVPGYGYLWWLPPEEGYMAIGYGGQYIAVYPERGLVIGIHSAINNNETYQSQLFYYIHNHIAPIFDGDE